ncbi:MAG: hypothetical protein JSW56_09025 [Deltaproteobacteria bacterium]|nr:MAG: hypothetical protein JSW56_09025 [Deltaproteobacteria bacterium]
MERIIPLVIIGVFFYRLLFRKGGMGGMGCCGGHGSHDSHPNHDTPSDKLTQKHEDDVIDLREGDYTVLPSGKGKEVS